MAAPPVTDALLESTEFALDVLAEDEGEGSAEVSVDIRLPPLGL